jgi:hypothetical protein
LKNVCNKPTIRLLSVRARQLVVYSSRRTKRDKRYGW